VQTIPVQVRTRPRIHFFGEDFMVNEFARRVALVATTCWASGTPRAQVVVSQVRTAVTTPPR
jgi:hypothetical protein